MEEIYRSTYQTFVLFAKEALLIEIWNSASEDLNDEIYKKEFLLTNEVLAPYFDKIDKVLIDARNFEYPISPNLQDWHNQHVFARIKSGSIAKSALVTSKHILVQVSMEQTFDALETAPHQTIKVFDQVAQASQWLTGKTIDCRTTPYQIVYYTQANETLTQIWHADTENLEVHQLQQEFDELTDLAKTYHPFKLLINAQALSHPILPHTQNWLNQEVFPYFLMHKLKYMAIVISQNMHVQLSLDQALEDIKTYPIEVTSFDTPQEATHWLNP
ncbi:hypothetical protein [Microscilla marina]|uniref:STAS/SEC14 domain-containing protein n=1 Tax=Microscilla marina ATCC 23134 TaxID=313606 RepID=A1ZJ73_MICM2|nr:hypothetical protein [Microscilla marina]EAY29609.1 hypothetical protein M23134_00493 [Microscilla marina ATCC 23134]